MRQEIKDEFQAIIESLNNFMDRINKEDILDALMGCIDVTCDLFETEVKQIQQLFKK